MQLILKSLEPKSLRDHTYIKVESKVLILHINMETNFSLMDL